MSKSAGMLERPVQRGAIQLLRAKGYKAVHVPNGAHLAGNALQRIKQMAALKADGLSEGFPDLVIIGRQPLQIGFMESKREIGGVLSQDQKDWRDLLLARGFPWAMIKIPEDALCAVQLWGWE